MTRETKIIAVANQKGGVGKTTTAINFAAALANKRKKTLLIDSDPQGNASSGVGVSTKKCSAHLYHAYSQGRLLDEVIQKSNTQNLDVIPSNIDLVGSEIEMINQPGWEKILKNLLLPVVIRYDYIVVDCPPSLGLLTVNALTAANSVLIPMQCEYFAMEGLAQLISTIRSVKKSYNKDLFVEGLVLTMFDKRNKLTHQVAKEVAKHFKDQLFRTVIPRNVRLSECPSHGQTIFSYDNNSSGAKAYNSLANEFLRNQKE